MGAFQNILLSILLVLFSNSFLFAQSQKDFEVNPEKIQAWLLESNVPAVGIGIISDGELTAVKVFGELRKGISAADHSIFTIASVTKTISTMLVLKLVEMDQWSLDEPLYKYWIDPDVVEDERHKLLTTRHVLSHQSGLPNWRSSHASGKLEFLSTPGTKYNYSGEGFEYLRKAIENKFDQSFEALSDSLLFKPLDMSNTKFKFSKAQIDTNFAYRHNAEGKAYHDQGGLQTSSASGLLTTIEDFAIFGTYVMNHAGLSDSLYTEMTSTQINIKKDYDQGLGWQIIRNLPDDGYALMHEGGERGVSSIAILLPESKDGIIVFTNGDRGDEVYSKVVKEYLEYGEEILMILSGKSYDPESIKVIEVSPDLLSAYVGSYYIESFKMSVDIILENNTLKLASPYNTMNLYAESETKFFLKDDDFRIEFVNDNNTLSGIRVIYQGGKPEFAKKTK